MKELLEKIAREAEEALSRVNTKKDFERLRYDFLGRSGKLADISKQMKTLSAEEKKNIGKFFNELKNSIENSFNAHPFSKNDDSEDGKKTFIDYTLPGKAGALGSIHPIGQFMEKVISIFSSMGYEVIFGNEVETERYNFDFLNMPKDHPSRDIQDTFFIKGQEDWVLRTHTSNMQIRSMESRKPPVRILSPGRVYRHEATDASHESMFYQVEGFAIDRDIKLTDLLGTLRMFLEAIYGKVKLRFRPHYYPFVEPGLDVDMACLICGGKGCSVCKKTGWLEMIGSGMIHPTVLKNMNVDPKIWSGFAFGVGLDRLMILYYGIDDVRLSYQGDVRFLRQF